MKIPSRLLKVALLAATIGVTSAVQAAAPPTNYADHWQNSAEPGWGLSITQNADILFGALYIYDQGQPTWYSGSLTFVSATSNGVRSYSGTLYKTNGPTVGPGFDPKLVTYRAVGTISIEFGDDAHGTATWTIDGVGSVKSIQRFTYAANDITGGYIGSSSDVTYDCANPSRNGQVTTDPGFFSISTEAGQTVIRFPTCTVNGTFVQQGQVGTVTGTYGCTHGGNGTMKITGIRSEPGGIVASYTGRDDFSCSFRGNIGGMRQLQ